MRSPIRTSMVSPSSTYTTVPVSVTGGCAVAGPGTSSTAATPAATSDPGRDIDHTLSPRAGVVNVQNPTHHETPRDGATALR